uniref:ABC1 atypical kinase-like domain-containing protein n=1 Tax=Haptolina ericina TaxID=156174 RepID=A0A7S3BZY6_9EUKA
MLSTRVDVLPREVISELSQLQNNVPGFPAKRAMAIIRQELGKPADEIFGSFDQTPLAAASLAQVHRATLKSGEEVVVKVQRENLRELFDVDLFNIRLVAWLADRLDPQTEGVGSNWKGIAETSGTVLYREINFDIERFAADEFGRNFASSPDVKIPAVYANLSTPRVMTMEYCPGVKISNYRALIEAGFDPIHIASRLTTSYLEQICRHGFFHCDPHPGNLAVDDGYPGGRLVYYDFGMMERVDPDVKKGFVDLVFSIYENYPKEACDALEQMGVLRPGIDRFSIERIATDMLNTFQSTLASAENKWENQMTPEEKKASRRARRQKLGADLFATQAERPFLFPPKFTFVFRAFSTIDGIGKALDPRYDLSRISQPFLRELVDLRDGSAITTAFRELGKRVGLRPMDIAQLVGQPRSVASVQSTMKRLEDGDLKLRVRAMELERVLERVELRQRLVGAGLGTVALLQVASVYSGAARTLVYVACARLALEGRRAWSAMDKLEQQRLRFSNESPTSYDEVDFYAGEEGQFRPDA